VTLNLKCINRWWWWRRRVLRYVHVLIRWLLILARALYRLYYRTFADNWPPAAPVTTRCKVWSKSSTARVIDDATMFAGRFTCCL
jgi:hypothetical protein